MKNTLTSNEFLLLHIAVKYIIFSFFNLFLVSIYFMKMYNNYLENMIVGLKT